MKKSISIFVGVVAYVLCFATPETMNFICKTDKNPLTYKCGEEMKFEIQFTEDGKPKAGQPLEWVISSDDGAPVRKGKAVSAETPLKLTASCKTPGFVRVRVWAKDKDNKTIYAIRKSDKRRQQISFQGGAGACIEKIKSSTQEPADFDAFWQRQLDALAKVPIKCDKKLLPQYSKDEFNVWELTISCVGKPTKAFLSIPKNAKVKSLPLEVQYIGYGVNAIYPYNKRNKIVLRVERHFYELLREKKYYDDMRNGELKAFGLLAKENENPENCYFKNMILRDIRALQYAKKYVKEWNGKDICVHGGSMGGFQSVFVAMLDNDVKHAILVVPWMTDLWASNHTTRQKCEFTPQWTPSIRYFDSNNAIKRVKCRVDVYAWLGDYVCPPAGIMVLYNNAKCPITFNMGQNGNHGGSVSMFVETSQQFHLKKN